MANEKTDISEIVKKCKNLLLDIEGTTTSISFVKDKLFPYAEENVKDFLNDDWDTDDVKEVVAALRKLAAEDEEKKVEGVVAIPGEDASKEDQIEALVKSVKWQMSSDRKVGPLKQLQGLIWKKGYDKGDIKGHVYDDVLPALEQWRSVEGQKVYIYSSGSVQAQKLLFGMSSAGDMLKLIDGHFDTAVGAKQEAASYTAITEKIGCKAEEILFLTDIDKEAEAARSAGVQTALLSREGNAPLSDAVTAAYPVLYSFAELAATNKRKPDDPQEEQPAKVLKTDAETDVKKAPEADVKENAEPAATETVANCETTKEADKMEVEEETATKETEKEKTGNSAEAAVEKTETIVEEVTDSNDIADVPVCDIEPIIEENNEKTEKKETEMMETESAAAADSVAEPKQNGDKNGPVPEETPPAVITEIKDITNDKESLNEVSEMIEDIVPVVEEPPSHDAEELQSVGEVLEKECDEILSKDISDDKQTADKNEAEREAVVKNGTESTDSTGTPTAPKENVDEFKVEKGNATEDKVEESSPAEQKVEVSTNDQLKEDKNAEKTKMEQEKVENKMETEVSAPETNDSTPKVEEKATEDKKDTEDKKVEDKPVEESKETPTEQKATEASTMETEQTETPVEKKENDKGTTVAEEVKPENDVKEPQLNGKTANGDADMVNLNGDASKEDELSARLSMENGNGKEIVNGANGDSVDSIEKAKSENQKVEEIKEVADIKVKTIDEPRNDPIEQPTEA